MEKILKRAIKNNQKALSEFESKKVLQSAGIPITREKLATTVEEAVSYANELGFPVVLKGCSHTLTHKTELGVVRLNLSNDNEVKKAYEDINEIAPDVDGVLIQEMVSGKREFVIGLHRDPQFGPCVMFGLGGIFTEVLNDATFRVAPLTRLDAEEMIDEIKASRLLGEFRGGPAVDREVLIKALIGIGDLGVKQEAIAEIDVNPLIIHKGKPIAVDGLVVMAPSAN